MSNGDPDETDDTQLSASTGASQKRTLSPDVLELDHVYSTLSHSRRRFLCYTLLEDTEWSLSDLATKIAAWENDVPEHAVTAQQRDRVYVSLYHAHVPKLVDEGVITFDDTSETIVAARHAEQVLTALEAIGTALDNEQEQHARDEMDDRTE